MKNAIDFIKSCPLELKDTFSEIAFECGETILIQNDISNNIYIIKEGRAKIYSLTSNAVKYLGCFYNSGELFGEVEIFNNTPVLNYVEAVTNCTVIKIPKQTFLQWLSVDSEFSLYINRQLANKLYNSSITSSTNVVFPLKYKLLLFIWRFLKQHNTNSVHKDIIVTGIGSNIRSVNRVIKELSDSEILSNNKGVISLVNPEKLFDLIKYYL